MNEKLQRTYYIVGIIQRLSMVALTFGMMVASYKIYELSIKSLELIQSYGIEIKEIHKLLETIYTMLHKSWFF